MRPAAAQPKVAAVLFDLDGTLLDTAPDLVFALNAALDEAGLPACPENEVKPFISGGARAMLGYALGRGIKRQNSPDSSHPYPLPEERVVKDSKVGWAEERSPTASTCWASLSLSPTYLLQHLPEGEGEKLLQRMLDLYEANLADRTRFFDGVETVLDALDSRGLPWGIVTNKVSRFTDPLADALNLSGRSGCIVSGDTTAEKKPHPLPLLEASRRLGREPGRCVYIGDAAKDMEAGRRAGMTTLAALYGYIGAEDEPGGWGADGLLTEPRELLAWLDGRPRP